VYCRDRDHSARRRSVSGGIERRKTQVPPGWDQCLKKIHTSGSHAGFGDKFGEAFKVEIRGVALCFGLCVTGSGKSGDDEVKEKFIEFIIERIGFIFKFAEFFGGGVQLLPYAPCRKNDNYRTFAIDINRSTIIFYYKKSFYYRK
jgi:hypothetical protein